MVAINSDVDESVAVELAEPLDAVGRVEITTSSTSTFKELNIGTGTLVAPNKVLTSAHVIDSNLDGIIDVEDFSQYSFELGDDLNQDSDYSLEIEDVSLHPEWTASRENRVSSIDVSAANPRYDLAVLTLNQNFNAVEPITVSPNIAQLTDNDFLLGKKATLVGYGQPGSPNATGEADGLRRAAENTIDSTDNGIIRLDYDSTSASEQTSEQGLNNPAFDGSSPELIRVTDSSPRPIRLEGGIGQGDSGGPLLVESDFEPVAIGVASEFLNLDSSESIVSGYGSVYIYSALNEPETIDFLEDEKIISLDESVTATSTSSRDFEMIEKSSESDDFINSSDDFT